MKTPQNELKQLDELALLTEPRIVGASRNNEFALSSECGCESEGDECGGGDGSDPCE